MTKDVNTKHVKRETYTMKLLFKGLFLGTWEIKERGTVDIGRKTKKETVVTKWNLE